MEALIFIALIIIIILLAGIRSKQKEVAEKSHSSYLSLKKELSELREAGLVAIKKDAPLKATDEEVVQWRPYKAPEVLEKIKDPKPIIPDPSLNKIEDPIIPPASISPAIENTDRVQSIKPVIIQNSEGWWEKWLRNNPDLEKFVGENLVNKIGITVLVLGIAFFVKYAIDQNWINEIGRVCIGISSGIILICLAHYLSKSYRSFSSVLAGGGIAIFYFTIAFAFHEYQIFSQSTAFVIMIVITLFAVAIALLYDKIELAVIALIGGFIAPFLVSTGSGNYIALFSYLLILNIGMLVISYFKKWPLLLVLSFIFTWLIFGSWLVKGYLSGENIPYKNALLFATSFYLIFLTSSLIHNLRTQKRFKPFDFSLLLFITFSYFAQGMYILNEWNSGAFQGIFTIALGLLNLCLAWYLFKTQKGDRNLLYLLIGLTLTFISLAAPVQLHGHTITLFWSAECVLLYWLHQRSNIRIFKYSSALLLLLTGISLMMDWSIADKLNNGFLPVIFTSWQGIITNLVVIISLGLYAFLLHKKMEATDYLLGLSNAVAGKVLGTAAVLLLYISFIFGINLYFNSQAGFIIPNAYHQLITYSFVILILMALKRVKDIQKPTLSIFLILACFVFYLGSSNLSNKLINGIIENNYNSVHAITHWLSAALMLYLLYKLIVIFRENISALGYFFSWLITALLLVFFSIECKQLYVSLLAGTENVSFFTAQYLKAGLTIVWAVFSFVIIWLGMKHKYKPLRIIALSIFTLALLKLFLIDIINISEGGKIVAFIMLGILLLVISFMYQRLKKIIIDNEEKTV